MTPIVCFPAALQPGALNTISPPPVPPSQIINSGQKVFSYLLSMQPQQPVLQRSSGRTVGLVAFLGGICAIPATLAVNGSSTAMWFDPRGRRRWGSHPRRAVWGTGHRRNGDLAADNCAKIIRSRSVSHTWTRADLIPL